MLVTRQSLDLCSMFSFCPQDEYGIQLMANRKYAHNVTSGYWHSCIVEYNLHTGRISELHIKPGGNNSYGRNQTADGCCPAFVSVLQAINFCFFRRVISASYCHIKGVGLFSGGNNFLCEQQGMIWHRTLEVMASSIPCSFPIACLDMSKPLLLPPIFTRSMNVNKEFWDITPCSSVKIIRCFVGTCRFHLQSIGISQIRNKQTCCILNTDFLFG
jgi:hypothetical protein